MAPLFTKRMVGCFATPETRARLEVEVEVVCGVIQEQEPRTRPQAEFTTHLLRPRSPCPQKARNRDIIINNQESPELINMFEISKIRLVYLLITRQVCSELCRGVVRVRAPVLRKAVPDTQKKCRRDRDRYSVE